MINELSNCYNKQTVFLPRILSRERGGVIREFYKNIYPNLTIVNVEKPAGFLRKFSPDGKYLIAFTYDQTSLEIYRFKGSGAAAVSLHLLLVIFKKVQFVLFKTTSDH